MRSLRAAASFLTVLPVANADGSPGARLGRAYFPAIGAVVGLAAGLVFVLLSAFLAPLVAAACAIARLTLLTGAIHLDGLADSADGLLGSRGDAARRLEVMRDPRLGSFGVIAIVLVLVLAVAALSSMSPARGLAALVIAGALSRLATLAVIAFVPYVRTSGLGVAAWDTRHRAADLLFGSAAANTAATRGLGRPSPTDHGVRRIKSLRSVADNRPPSSGASRMRSGPGRAPGRGRSRGSQAMLRRARAGSDRYHAEAAAACRGRSPRLGSRPRCIGRTRDPPDGRPTRRGSGFPVLLTGRLARSLWPRPDSPRRCPPSPPPPPPACPRWSAGSGRDPAYRPRGSCSASC